MNFDNQEYEEHILISTGNGIAMMPHHIMKLNTPKFSFDSLTKPIKLTRKSDLPQEEEQKERTIHRSKKSKAFFLGREDQDVVLGGGEIQPGTLIAPIGSRYADPDKSPWILRDAEQHTFQGTVEGSQSSNYVLFVNAQNGFKVIPVQKWYKFSKKVEPKVTSLEEAEEKLKTMKQDRWTAHEETKKSWKEKLMNIVEDVEPKKSKKVDLEDIGMDFEEQMSDDEDVDFGIENEEEAKEAQKRVLKEEEASTWKSSLEKVD
jgi:transcription initiation factor TFIIF subunit alpha